MYGPSSTIGAGVGYKNKKNFYFGIEGNYIFGGKVQNGDEIIAGLLTEDGQLIGQSGEYAIFQYYERGYTLFFQFRPLHLQYFLSRFRIRVR